MEQVNLGSLPDGTGGDSIRVGFQKCNDNFTEVAEQLKTAGVASAEELKQIKDAATALAERVEKLEKASGGGGGVPADELAALEQQLQQLQTKLTAAVQAAGGAASQAEAAAHAASAAQQTASGAAQTANAAKQEAAAAKQAADGKAPASHTHTAAQISDLSTAVSALVEYQRVGNFDICKFANGVQIESGTVRVQNHANSPNARALTWPLAFASPPTVTGTISAPDGNIRDAWLTIDSRQSTQAATYYWIHEPVYNAPDVTVHFVAIGRWK